MPVLTDEFTEGAWGSMGHIAVTDGLDLAWSFRQQPILLQDGCGHR